MTNDDHLLIGKIKLTNYEKLKEINLQIISLEARVNELGSIVMEMTQFMNAMCGHLIEKGIIPDPNKIPEDETVN